MASPTIECTGLWKVFGDNAGKAITTIKQDRLSREQALSRFGCLIAVSDVSLSVNEGEIFCVMGLSGSGKSTLVRHVNRLVEPSAGEVRIFGRDINKMPRKELREFRSEKVGMVFQHVALFPHKTVSENVSFGLELRKVSKKDRARIAEEKLQLVKLDGWGKRYPHELSGGMQQRVGLARAFASDTPLVLMDEPFSALDPLIRRELQIEFRQLAKSMKKTVLFITHDIDEAIFLGDRIAIMKDGELCQIATPQELVLHPASEYIADFVRHASRLKTLRAGMLMKPMSQCAELSLDKCYVVRDDDDLESLIANAIEGRVPMAVMDRSDNIVGVITRETILSGLNAESRPEGAAMLDFQLLQRISRR